MDLQLQLDKLDSIEKLDTNTASQKFVIKELRQNLHIMAEFHKTTQGESYRYVGDFIDLDKELVNAANLLQDLQQSVLETYHANKS